MITLKRVRGSNGPDQALVPRRLHAALHVPPRTQSRGSVRAPEELCGQSAAWQYHKIHTCMVKHSILISTKSLLATCMCVRVGPTLSPWRLHGAFLHIMMNRHRGSYSHVHLDRSSYIRKVAGYVLRRAIYHELKVSDRFALPISRRLYLLGFGLHRHRSTPVLRNSSTRVLSDLRASLPCLQVFTFSHQVAMNCGRRAETAHNASKSTCMTRTLACASVWHRDEVPTLHLWTAIVCYGVIFGAMFYGVGIASFRSYVGTLDLC